ncbi:MAG TPA: formyltransferase family protein [Gemmatimonadales bacterium]|nr:formyltransferase family protein [Gemmatimonadales bacterium]
MEFAAGIRPMKTVLICHHDDALNRVGIARWLASFSDLVGVVEIREPGQRLWRRIRRELRRVGPVRFLDVLAYRAYERLMLARGDRAWEAGALDRLRGAYPELSSRTVVLPTSSPNSPEVVSFLRRCAPDVMLARCKSLLSQQVFERPVRGTFVLHPGICPEYRNAHGCFWALANDDLQKVGATLLRIDAGVDTGPVYGHYGYAFDEVVESPFVIQHRVVLENLEAIRRMLIDVAAGRATPLDVSRRASATWGQPWLTKYLRWKYRARRRRRESACAAVP